MCGLGATATSSQQCEAASSDRSKFFSGQKKKLKIETLPARRQLLMWRSGALLAAK
jgi:hypothetical protein